MALIPVSVFEAKQERLLGLLQELVEIESPTTNKLSVDGLGRIVAGKLRALGANVETVRQEQVGDFLIARWGSGKNGTLILCHLDTVHELGTLERMPWRIADGRVMGPGVLDMKASITIVLSALRELIEHGVPYMQPLTILFTTDEEVGSIHSRSVIEALGREASLVLCPEPSLLDGSLKTGRKGIGNFQIDVRGRAAHAGMDHEQGRNAIQELAYHILAIQKLTDYSKGTTLNVGVVSGGTRSNIVPDHARVIVDFRVTTTEETERVIGWMNSLEPVLPGVALKVSGGLNRPTLVRDARMMETFLKAREIARRLGIVLGEGQTGGGSDANFIAPFDIPILDGLGATGDGAHSEREYIEIDSLAKRTALFAGILSEW